MGQEQRGTEKHRLKELGMLEKRQRTKKYIFQFLDTYRNLFVERNIMGRVAATPRINLKSYALVDDTIHS